MRRGTTPTISITVKGLSDIQINKAYLTLKQRGTVVEKTEADMEIDGDMLQVALTQEETLKFMARAEINVQLRVLSTNNTAYASNIVTVPVEAILKEGMIPEGGTENPEPDSNCRYGPDGRQGDILRDHGRL